MLIRIRPNTCTIWNNGKIRGIREVEIKKVVAERHQLMGASERMTEGRKTVAIILNENWFSALNERDYEHSHTGT